MKDKSLGVSMNSTAKKYFLLHIILLLYSTGGIFSKLAAGEKFLSVPFILLYGIQILILLVYAFGWQQVLKVMPLSTAYANKAVTIVWGGLWGVLFFYEKLSAGKIVGCLIVLAGVALYGYADGKKRSEGTAKL